jgi:uncharacterized Fe-S cluster-containing radical SAM superfamily protein
MAAAINTDQFSKTLRERSINVAGRKLLITNFLGSEQEKDLTVPANCNGYGRIRHFRRETSDGWPLNPLPIDPASKALGIPSTDLLHAQVFQNASCNWRCWYCYVQFSLLAADETHSGWLSPAELMDLYLNQPSPPKVIDLSGGQPDLVPEWIPWMMEELRSRQLDDSIYLWSDDNLSNDYFWKFLSNSEREVVATYKNYGKVCCFKGFDAESFAFNTCAAPELFDRQIDLMKRYVGLSLDVYGYVTLTTPAGEGIPERIKRFFDCLQAIHPNLPLRVIPLEIKVFTPVVGRADSKHHESMANQQRAIAAWQNELHARFRQSDLDCNISDVSMI